jgi:multidrug resistance efflux pump
MEHQFFIRQQNLKPYRSLVAAAEAAVAKADARQEKRLTLLAEEVANEPPPRKN